jgi:2-oxo-4-hydroxy-4-carboxy-5-ureidoimidazoline decarboxylase
MITKSAPKMPLRRLNMMNAHGFVRTVGPVFENAPWVAERAFHFHPFHSVEELHEKLCQVIKEASEEEKLAMIRAQPDLVGQIAGRHMAQPRADLAAAGLDRLSSEEVEAFQAYNDVYRETFDFPFIICTADNPKSAILSSFPRRLKHTREREMDVAMEEICKTAKHRLQEMLAEE